MSTSEPAILNRQEQKNRQQKTQQPSEIWFTRCPVPTATGLAYNLGWLSEEFAADGIRIAAIQEAPRELSRHHYDHEIPTLIREGGNLLALAAKAQGAPTKLIGLTWIDEAQAIIVRPDSAISAPAHLEGKRVALPAYVHREIPAHVRGSSIARGMSLHGVKGALSIADLTLDDVTFVEVGSGQNERGDDRLGNLWSGLDALVESRVDAVYVKGASAVEAARERGLKVGIDLDKFPDRRARVNNGTPRPITVHDSLLANHFDLVVRFLAQTLRAADWATDNLQSVYGILKSETRAGDEGVTAAYRDGFHRSLHPDLSTERVDLLRIQKDFMWVHGFLDANFELSSWIDPRPLTAARDLINRRHGAARDRVGV
jgi:ABC-type nitrate/sulfonate/bicarbonate transport system substrate-binding protein